MRLATLRVGETTTAAREDASGYVPIPGFRHLSELLSHPDWRELARTASAADPLPPDAPRSLAFPSAGKIVCAGLNYRGHILELGRELPTHPTLFAKFADTLTGPDDPIEIPEEDTQVDWEGELAVVIGQTAYRVSVEEAKTRIAGYTVANDVSMRGWQNRTIEWLQGKIWARSTPLGPVMVTPDDFDPETAMLVTTVNGQTMQEHSIADMVFSPEELVSYISTMVPLRPGDLVLTGTPGGIGHARRPPVYLRAGDEVTVSIDGIGSLYSIVAPQSGF